MCEQVGPESAGAHPGPVCYRKGGYAAITDANLVLGRIMPEFFPNIFGPHEVRLIKSCLRRCRQKMGTGDMGHHAHAAGPALGC
jgi:5-oxoprolinase (ATP-hydrolysing)